MNAMKEKYNVQWEHVTWWSKLVWSSKFSEEMTLKFKTWKMSCNHLGRNYIFICKIAKKMIKETEKKHPMTEKKYRRAWSQKAERRGGSKRKGEWSSISKEPPSSNKTEHYLLNAISKESLKEREKKTLKPEEHIIHYTRRKRREGSRCWQAYTIVGEMMRVPSNGFYFLIGGWSEVIHSAVGNKVPKEEGHESSRREEKV